MPVTQHNQKKKQILKTDKPFFFKLFLVLWCFEDEQKKVFVSDYFQQISNEQKLKKYSPPKHYIWEPGCHMKANGHTYLLL